MSRRLPALLATLVAGFALAACGGDGERGSVAATTATGTDGTQEAPAQQPAGPAVATVDVAETEFKLSPANPKVSKAGVIAFKASNDGQAVHALEVEGPKGEARTGEIQPGGSAMVEVELPEGTYVWYCPVANHRQLGMEGKVTVAGGGPVRDDRGGRGGSGGGGGRYGDSGGSGSGGSGSGGDAGGAAPGY